MILLASRAYLSALRLATIVPLSLVWSALDGDPQTHTKNCQCCLGALKNVKKALKATKTSAVVSFAWVS